jgi:hypothetical protein
MIIVTAQMWPDGQEASAYEVMTMSITNQGGTERSDYNAHVLARPNYNIGCEGYEADVYVRQHERHTGLAPLLISVLAAAEDKESLAVPAGQAMRRVIINDMEEFAQRLKGRIV